MKKVIYLTILLSMLSYAQDSVHISKSGKYHKRTCATLVKSSIKLYPISVAEGTDGLVPCKLCMFERSIRSIKENGEYAEVHFLDGKARTYDIQEIHGNRYIVVSGRIISLPITK